MDNSQIRLHIPGIPYTITRDEYSHDAFTGKVKKFAPMMRSRGFEVYHYGVETSESGATQHFDLLTKEEWRDLRIKTVKFVEPHHTHESAVKRNDDPSMVVNVLSNWCSPLTVEFNKRFREKLKENYRSTKTDIVCVPLGRTYQTALDGLDLVKVEVGIGYGGSYFDFRIFESYAWMSHTLGSEQKQPHNYWFVVPHGFDLNEFKYSVSPNPLKVGYMGRVTDLKGCHIIKEVAKRFPHVEFVMCGQGDPLPFLDPQVPNLKYKSPIHGRQRSDFLGECVAFLHPVRYLEPFGCGPVEAQLCGTPVISSDSGGLVETVEQHKTGLRCHTLADYCHGIQMALDGKFDRRYVRDRAANLYDMYKVAPNYEYIFKTLLDVYNPAKNGWYSPDNHISVLSEPTAPVTAKRIYLFVPYYGEVPNYFQLYLDSLAANEDILTVFFVTDIDLSSYKLPTNFVPIKMGLPDVRCRLSALLYKTYKKHISFTELISNSYKLVDIKILYPILFGDYLEQHNVKPTDFVGWGDCDLIYGKLSRFLNLNDGYGILGGYHGHFTAIVNNESFKNNFQAIPDYFDLVTDNSKHYGVDEIAYRKPLEKYIEANEVKVFPVHLHFCDVVPPQFYSLFRPRHATYASNFFDVYNSKKTIRHIKVDRQNNTQWCHYDDGSCRETFYTHLQKRKMELTEGCYATGYNIEENAFVPASAIPLKIWQTWSTKELPTHMKACVEELKVAHPEFEHTVFDDSNCLEFLKNNFPTEVVQAYEALIPGAYKADLWRLCVLYIHGGVYLDIKYKLENEFNLKHIVHETTLVSDGYFTHKEKQHPSIYNALMACAKNDLFLLDCIINIVYNVSVQYYGSSPWHPTGPCLLGLIYGKPITGLKHTHRGPITNETIQDSKSVVIASHYPEYREEQKAGGAPRYLDLWRAKKVYNPSSIDLQKVLKEQSWPEPLLSRLTLFLNTRLPEYKLFGFYQD